MPSTPGGKTLKLKAAPQAKTSKTQATAEVETGTDAISVDEATGAPLEEAVARPAVATASPGVVYTLAAAASLLVVGAQVGLAVMQFLKLF